jgi:hypothetical protein
MLSSLTHSAQVLECGNARSDLGAEYVVDVVYHRLHSELYVMGGLNDGTLRIGVIFHEHSAFGFGLSFQCRNAKALCFVLVWLLFLGGGALWKL